MNSEWASSPGYPLDPAAMALLGAGIALVSGYYINKLIGLENGLIVACCGLLLYLLGGWTLIVRMMRYRCYMTETLEIISDTVGTMSLSMDYMLDGMYQLSQVVVALAALAVAVLVLMVLKR